MRYASVVSLLLLATSAVAAPVPGGLCSSSECWLQDSESNETELSSLPPTVNQQPGAQEGSSSFTKERPNSKYHIADTRKQYTVAGGEGGGPPSQRNSGSLGVNSEDLSERQGSSKVARGTPKQSSGAGSGKQSKSPTEEVEDSYPGDQYVEGYREKGGHVGGTPSQGKVKNLGVNGDDLANNLQDWKTGEKVSRPDWNKEPTPPDSPITPITPNAKFATRATPQSGASSGKQSNDSGPARKKHKSGYTQSNSPGSSKSPSSNSASSSKSNTPASHTEEVEDSTNNWDNNYAEYYAEQGGHVGGTPAGSTVHNLAVNGDHLADYLENPETGEKVSRPDWNKEPTPPDSPVTPNSRFAKRATPNTSGTSGAETGTTQPKQPAKPTEELINSYDDANYANNYVKQGGHVGGSPEGTAAKNIGVNGYDLALRLHDLRFKGQDPSKWT